LAQSQYSIVDLGGLGGVVTRARAINDQGQIAGEALLPSGMAAHAVSWQTEGIFDLGTLGGQSSGAFDINHAGTIAGWAQTGSSDRVAALWDGGNIVPLPSLGGASVAYAINDVGAAVGASYLGGVGYRATRWDAQGIHDLGTLGGPHSLAFDINNSGAVSGAVYDQYFQEHATVWEPDGPVDLGGLDGGSWTAAYQINDSGGVILWGTPQGATASRASYWDGDPASSVLDLGTFGGLESWAYGLNDNGFVVGSADLPDGTYHAFVWDGAEKTDLGTLGGSYSLAYGINDAGVVVGFALDRQGVTHAVAWLPVPETGSVLAAMLSAALLLLFAKLNR
jgi:probable HAF family extracellular repeat protein